MLKFNKKTRNILSVFLCGVLLGVPMLPCTASGEQTARLYEVYDDAMLFQHDEEAILAGEAKPGSAVSCELKNADGTVIRSAVGKTGQDGTFSVSFKAPAGGYDEYTICMYNDGACFATLSRVVFGELWMAGGQSNMHWFLGLSETGMEMKKNGITGSENIRFLDMPLIPEYDGSADNIPDDPQNDIKDACWFDGTSEKIYTISAIAYFYAEQLQKDLDMPVGVLCNYLGGSSVYAWLSREAIESDSGVRDDLGDKYIPSNRWKRANLNNLSSMCALYNKKTAPLRNFRIAGMIWYQGESDCNNAHGAYMRAFSLLQEMLTKDFHYENGLLPVVISLVANSPVFGINSFQLLNAEYGEIQQAQPETRAIVSINDLPLTYTAESSTVHPVDKKPIALRMADAAEGMVYHLYENDYTAPVLLSCVAENDTMLVKFDCVGDGLAVSGSTLYGFTVCGEDGVYVPTDAEIISADTVRVHCAEIGQPVAVMYAQGPITTRCNLYSTRDGKLYLPACPAVSDRDYTDNIWRDFGWTDCDTNEIWREESLAVAGFYKIWEAEQANLTVCRESAQSGNGGLRICSDAEAFSVSPVTSYYDEQEDTVSRFAEFNSDWSKYGKISFSVRNDSDREITFEGLRITTENGKILVPVADGTKECSCVIPADGAWHTVTLDLSTLYFNGKNGFVTASNRYLKDVTDAEFAFTGETGTVIAMDSIRFTPDASKIQIIRFRTFGLFTLLMNLLVRIISLIAD